MRCKMTDKKVHWILSQIHKIAIKRNIFLSFSVSIKHCILHSLLRSIISVAQGGKTKKLFNCLSAVKLLVKCYYPRISAFIE